MATWCMQACALKALGVYFTVEIREMWEGNARGVDSSLET